MSTLKVEVKRHYGDWQGIKDTAMTTVGKDAGKYPDTNWKKKILLAEHSPIRNGMFRIKIYNIQSWVATHLVRHHVGVEKFVQTQREDRTGVDRGSLPQNALVDMDILMNFQAIINISRKRLCSQASKETREVWQMILDAIKDLEPELYESSVKECVYRGFCPEMRGCMYSETEQFKKDLEIYRRKKRD